MTSMENLANSLIQTGQIEEAHSLRRRRIEILSKNPSIPSLDLRRLAFDCFQLGDYSKTRELLNRLLETGFKPPETRHHLARVCLMMDRIDEVHEHVAQGWAVRADAEAYILARLLWFQLTIGMLENGDRSSLPEDTQTMKVLGRMKTVLKNQDAHLQWDMKPVLDDSKYGQGRRNPLDAACVSRDAWPVRGNHRAHYRRRIRREETIANSG